MFVAAMVWFVFLVPAQAQDGNGESTPPSIHAGDWLVVNFRTKIHMDVSRFRPEVDEQRKAFQVRRLRFGVDGTLFNNLDYSVRVETRKANPQFRDVFLKYRGSPSIQIQAGRFKIPFGLDQLTDSGELDFVQRSRIGSILAPGRDTGLMVLGEVLERNVNYAAGIFQHDGRNAEIEDFAAVNEYLPGGYQTLAARVTILPANLLSSSGAFRNLTVSAALTRSQLTTGLSSLPGVTASDQIFFPRMYVSGTRLRRGAEITWLVRSLSIKGELMEVREQRMGQGLHGEDLPALRADGWYLSATHPLFGHLDKRSDSNFLRSIIPGKGLGLLEVTARYETIRFSSERSAGSLPSRSPRAENVFGNDDRAWTLGINWYVNHYVKLQLNAEHENLRDPVRTPLSGNNRYWTQVGRFQLFF
jgi:phosphate-selective porin OprO/OprP